MYVYVCGESSCLSSVMTFLPVSRYPEYTRALIDHLVEMKVGHWDSAIRELTAKVYTVYCCHYF